mmetsp:Transcript_108075/g.345153  ORF Transcript_108075/g.345153 Transcript_108075/m.345153 type:complete len:92 (+) Transcript_108075:290-565(+)
MLVLLLLQLQLLNRHPRPAAHKLQRLITKMMPLLKVLPAMLTLQVMVKMMPVLLLLLLLATVRRLQNAMVWMTPCLLVLQHLQLLRMSRQP